MNTLRFRAPRPVYFAAVGIAVLLGAVLASRTASASAARQDWPAFVLVAGLLVIGLVADDDGVFATLGSGLSRLRGGEVGLYAGAVLALGVVTALLNLDTSVAFLTPVLVYGARRKGAGEQLLLAGAIVLSNAGSLFLPGSNLTNLIVLGPRHLSGASFFARMWAPALVALLASALVVFVFGRGRDSSAAVVVDEASRPAGIIGSLAVLAASVVIIVVRTPALYVLGIGLGAGACQLARRRIGLAAISEAVGASTLIGLFGIAVGLGALGRDWGGPTRLLAHLDLVGTAVLGALSTVVLNNLPAASLLAARPPREPYALLIGLNLGPNLFVTGSLAWVLWIRSARRAGAVPRLSRTTMIGAASVPAAMAAALAVLSAMGTR
jgi:arsenical pump membrane protein